LGGDGRHVWLGGFGNGWKGLCMARQVGAKCIIGIRFGDLAFWELSDALGSPSYIILQHTR
jgi:hypothetical protein